MKWAAQVGATDFVSRYATVSTPEKMCDECAPVAKFRLKLSVVEGHIPLNGIIRGGENRDAQIGNAQQLIAAMG